MPWPGSGEEKIGRSRLCALAGDPLRHAPAGLRRIHDAVAAIAQRVEYLLLGSGWKMRGIMSWLTSTHPHQE